MHSTDVLKRRLNYCPPEKRCELLKRYHEDPEFRKKRLEYAKAYYQKNRERLIKYSKEYLEKNRARYLFLQRRYKEENPEKSKETVRKWNEKNKARKRMIQYRYANRLASLPKQWSESDWAKAVLKFDGKCAYCGHKPDKLHTDHFIPISSPECPGTVPWNMVPCCQLCNNRKRTKHPKDFIEDRGLYDSLCKWLNSQRPEIVLDIFKSTTTVVADVTQSPSHHKPLAATGHRPG